MLPETLGTVLLSFASGILVGLAVAAVFFEKRFWLLPKDRRTNRP